jgi:hypothetical protein
MSGLGNLIADLLGDFIGGFIPNSVWKVLLFVAGLALLAYWGLVVVGVLDPPVGHG